MASLVFDDATFRKAMAYIDALSQRGQKAAVSAVNRLAEEWHREIVRHMPVDVGLAKNSTAVSPAELLAGVVRAAVGTNVPYVPHLEFGTRLIAGGRVAAWKPGEPPVTDWPAKSGGLTGLSASQRGRAQSGGSTEFMPPMRGSWPAVIERGLVRLRKQLADQLRKGAA